MDQDLAKKLAEIQKALLDLKMDLVGLQFDLNKILKKLEKENS
jgi:hypothetical protein